MKNYLINERQLKKILEQVEDEENKDEETNNETVSADFFDSISNSPLDSNDPLKMFFDSLN